ncbi:glycolate oxidase subunit GlcE [Panacagrimonas sp.]|uniref:glycolate oxidase subunit GlcE n=1 Tax=Panacagrimonas sp. TaxID=2480088 RepID=UPI003B517AB1
MMNPSPSMTISDPQDLQAAFADALAEGRRLRIRGGDSKLSMLGDIDVHGVLDLSALRGVVAYEPGELVLTVKAGTPLIEVQMLLADRDQMLAFEPQDYAGVLGAAPGMSTIGGVIASGWAGPRRVVAGNVRDHVLGFEAVSARGEFFRAGGRVIKNVTGYDLPKLLTGSWGTLAALTDICLRVLPRPACEATLSVESLDDAAALGVLRRALAAPLEVSAAACLPRDRRALIRLEGFPQSVAERLRQLQALLSGAGDTRVIEDEASSAIWRRVGEVWDFHGDERTLWRLSLPSEAAAQVVAEFSRNLAVEAIYDWGGSLVWLAVDDAPNHAEQVRRVAQGVGGHAWLFRAAAGLRAEVATAHPLTAPLQGLSARIKAGFDPKATLPSAPLWPQFRANGAP